MCILYGNGIQNHKIGGGYAREDRLGHSDKYVSQLHLLFGKATFQLRLKLVIEES